MIPYILLFIAIVSVFCYAGGRRDSFNPEDEEPYYLYDDMDYDDFDDF